MKKNKKHTKKSLFINYKNLQKRLGRQPNSSDWIKDISMPSLTTIRQHFGTWSNFMIYMGLEPFKSYCLSKEFLTEEYINKKKSLTSIAKELGVYSEKIRRQLIRYQIIRRTVSEATKGIINKREKHANWKGGRIKDHRGYILQILDYHPHFTQVGYVFEHRLVIEKEIGRYLQSEEVVHHINGVRDDNRIENLICFVNNSVHKRFHKDSKLVKLNEIIFDGRKTYIKNNQ